VSPFIEVLLSLADTYFLTAKAFEVVVERWVGGMLSRSKKGWVDLNNPKAERVVVVECL
jgi:hypothetical protein